MWGERSVSSVRGTRFLAEALRVRVFVFLAVTYQWCKGKSFPEICALTDQFEGSIIRTTRRLEGARFGCMRCRPSIPAGAVADTSPDCAELLRQLHAAATAIGNAELQDKFQEGTRLLKHGIIFAGSLYL